MAVIEINTFEAQELQPVLQEVDGHGPVDAFSLEGERKRAYKQQAVDTASLEGVLFTDCPAFDNLEYKAARQDAKTMAEISNILREARAEAAEDLTVEDEIVAQYIDYEVWMAVLVEGSRRATFAARGEGADSVESCAAMINRAQEELYVQPSPELAHSVLGLFGNRLASISTADAPNEVQEFAREFNGTYSFMQDIEPAVESRLDPAKRAEIRQVFVDRFQPAFDLLHSEFGDITDDMIPDVTNRLLEHLGYRTADDPNSGWAAKYVGKAVAGFRVQPAQKDIECGDRSKPITWEIYEQLILHEVGVHVERAVNGETLGVNPMLVHGMAGTIDFEEGLGLLIEKIWTGKEEGLERDHYRYLIGTYASGAIDGKKHSVDQTFKFAVQLKTVEKLATQIAKGEHIDVAAAQKSACSLIFEHVYRAFRGMPEGLTMNKNLAYYAKKVEVIEYFNNSELSATGALKYLLQAKFNPNDPKQVEYIDSLAGKK
jgi:hypothetical protein